MLWACRVQAWTARNSKRPLHPIPSALHSTANDVQLRDVLPANAEVVDGSLTATFKKIAVGSQVKHTYVIKFVAGGSMEAIFLDEATVSYKADAESGSTVSTLGLLACMERCRRHQGLPLPQS